MFKTVLLQAAASGGWQQFMLPIGMIAVFYLFFIRPQQKKQKDSKKFIEAVKKGDHVVTLGGIHGKVVSVEDSTITLDVDRGNKLVVEKSSLSLEASKRFQNES